RFKNARATVVADEAHPETARVEVEIDVASIDTGAADRDAHLLAADFFDAERYPTIRFRSTRVEGSGSGKEGDRFRLIGDLTIRDATMELALDCEFEGRGPDPWGKERAGFGASAEIDRREWGLRWNQAIETGGVLVANKVRIEVEAQFVRQGE
ncbi:MAG: YceI family protein, partial [Gemmatimonadaceae bacterium]